MSCQHVWERRDKQPWCLPYYICTECEMELSTSQYEAIQQAHRQGWEQCKMEAAEIAKQAIFPPPKSYYTLGREDVAKAIASMEYKEAAG